MDDLSLNKLRQANIQRCETSYHPVKDWTLTDWACAAAGEMGETCNVVKKLRRVEIQSGFTRYSENPDELYNALADEIADTVIYLDLLATRARINLATAIKRKFNATSARIDSPVTL